MASVVQAGGIPRVSIERILKRAVSAATGNPATVFGAWLAIAAFSGFWRWYVFNSGLASTTAGFTSGMIAVGIVGGLIGFVFTALSQSVMTSAVLAEVRGEKVGLGEALAASLPFILPIFGYCILWWFGLVIGMLLLIVPGIIVLTMWAVGIPALIVEREGVIAAFGRSRELTKGHRWKVLALLTLIVAACYPFQALLDSYELTNASIGPVRLAMVSLVGALVYLIWGLTSPSLYVELLEAKEGVGDDGLHDVFA